MPSIPPGQVLQNTTDLRICVHRAALGLSLSNKVSAGKWEPQGALHGIGKFLLPLNLINPPIL